MILCNNCLWIATGLSRSVKVATEEYAVNPSVNTSLPKYTFSIPALNSCDAIGSLAKSLVAVIVTNTLLRITLKSL
jgi:hypothetical protein